MEHIACMTSLRNTGCVANPVIPSLGVFMYIVMNIRHAIFNRTKRFILDRSSIIIIFILEKSGRAKLEPYRPDHLRRACIMV